MNCSLARGLRCASCGRNQGAELRVRVRECEFAHILSGLLGVADQRRLRAASHIAWRLDGTGGAVRGHGGALSGGEQLSGYPSHALIPRPDTRRLPAWSVEHYIAAEPARERSWKVGPNFEIRARSGRNDPRKYLARYS